MAKENNYAVPTTWSVYIETEIPAFGLFGGHLVQSIGEPNGKHGELNHRYRHP